MVYLGRVPGLPLTRDHETESNIHVIKFIFRDLSNSLIVLPISTVTVF